MPIVFTKLTGDWRHIIEDYITDPGNAIDGAGVTGTVTVTPVLGAGRHAPKGWPSNSIFYTLQTLDLRVYRGLLRDQNMDEDIRVVTQIDDFPVAWRAKFKLTYKGKPIPLHDVVFGPDEIVAGEISLSSLIATQTVPPEYEGSYLELLRAIERAELAVADAEEQAQIAHDASALAVLAAANAGRIMGTGSPEGVKDAPVGTIFVDTANGELWHKTTAEGSTSGWKLVGTGAAEAAPSWRRAALTADDHIDNLQGAASEGVWTMGSGLAAANNMPTVVAYTVEVVSTGSITYQRAIGMLNPVKVWERRYYNGTWTPWVTVADGISLWNRGSLASNATPQTVDDLPDGQYYIPTTARSNSAGMPESGLGILTCLIPTSAYKRQYWTTEPTNGEPSRWRRTYNSGSWNAWVKLAGADTSALEARVGTAETKITTLEGVVNGGGGGGLTREESAWALEREGRIADMRRRRGLVEVPEGVGLVALTFDHHTTKFRDNLWPLLSARNLPATLALNSARHLDGRTLTDANTTDNATDAQIKSWINTGRLEIANHSKTHAGATGYANVFDEIVNGQAELEAALGVPVDHFIQPGYATGDPDYDGFGRGYSTKVYWNTTAGRLIMKGHPGITGMIAHPTDVLPIDGHIPIGTRRQGYDSRTGWESAKAQIQLAADTGGRCINFCHPSSIYANDSSNQTFTKLFEFEEMLDLIVSLQNQGKIRAVLLSDWMIAQRSQA